MKKIDDYLEKVTNEHQNKPKFQKMLEAVINPFVEITNFNLNLNKNFDVDTSVGVQLDQDGLWVGFPRTIKTPLYVYFSLDTEGLGFDEGNWKGRFDPDQGLSVMDDDTYRFFMKVKIASNHWNGSIPQYTELIDLALLRAGVESFAIDNQDMSMDVYFFGRRIPALIRGLLKNGYFALKSEAVRINGFHEPSVPDTPFFGFDASSKYIDGFDVGSFEITF